MVWTSGRERGNESKISYVIERSRKIREMKTKKKNDWI